jgi:hypothetical protein
LDQHYVALREELHRTFETLGLAAAWTTSFRIIRPNKVPHRDNMLSFVLRLEG